MQGGALDVCFRSVYCIRAVLLTVPVLRLPVGKVPRGFQEGNTVSHTLNCDLLQGPHLGVRVLPNQPY